MKLICAHKLSECLNFVSLFVTPSEGVLPYNSVCLGLQWWSTRFFVNYLDPKKKKKVCLGYQCETLKYHTDKEEESDAAALFKKSRSRKVRVRVLRRLKERGTEREKWRRRQHQRRRGRRVVVLLFLPRGGRFWKRIPRLCFLEGLRRLPLGLLIVLEKTS